VAGNRGLSLLRAGSSAAFNSQHGEWRDLAAVFDYALVQEVRQRAAFLFSRPWYDSRTPMSGLL
tara:strand:- start:11024 stop:11215 length:192 start_codon:yes stop_codon:yes gene_type:complete